MSASKTPERAVEDGFLVSSALPAMRMRVEAALAYLATTRPEIKGLARAERCYFVDAPDGRVRRMLVVQFEGFLPSNNETYRYALPDPIRLGGETWGSWVFCYSVAESTAPETLDTVRLLRAHSMELDDEQIMVRYARIVGDDARHEVLIFYNEPLRRLGHTLMSVSEDGTVRPQYASLAVEAKARARRSFKLD